MSILKIIKNNINLFIVFVLFTIINLLSFTFGADLRSSLHYGIKNIAKVNKLIPITVTIENKDSDIFKGKLLVDHYENNESIYQYEFDIDINTFYIKVIDDKGESYLNERINIDLSSSDNKIITGIISDNDNLVDLLNDIYINDDFLEEFTGDGILIATSIGSTAYNISYGGSIVSPEFSTLQITPIAPINSKVYRTDEVGTITFQINNEIINANTCV